MVVKTTLADFSAASMRDDDVTTAEANLQEDDVTNMVAAVAALPAKLLERAFMFHVDDRVVEIVDS